MNLDSLVKLGETALGAFAVGWLNDAYTQPALEGAFKGLQTNHTMAKAVDAGSLVGTSWLAGEALDMVGLDRVATPVRTGGFFYAGLKAITILIPGAEAKLTTPSPLSLFRAALATNPPAAGGVGPGNMPASGPAPQVAGPLAQLGPAGSTSGSTNYGGSVSSQAAGQGGSGLAQTSGYALQPAGTFQFVPKPTSQYLDAGI